MLWAETVTIQSGQCRVQFGMLVPFHERCPGYWAIMATAGRVWHQTSEQGFEFSVER